MELAECSIKCPSIPLHNRAQNQFRGEDVAAQEKTPIFSIDKSAIIHECSRPRKMRKNIPLLDASKIPY